MTQTPNHTQTASLLQLLNDNHERAENLLRQLEQVTASCLQDAGCCVTISAGVHQLSSALNACICEHHSDEEVFIYQPLLNMNGHDADLCDIYSQLLEEHTQIEDTWALLHSMLYTAAHYPEMQCKQELADAFTAFIELKREHMVHEKAVIFPAAKALIGKPLAQEIALRITHRRQLAQKRLAVSQQKIQNKT